MRNRGKTRPSWVSIEVGVLAAGIVAIMVAVGIGASRGAGADAHGSKPPPAADSDSTDPASIDPAKAVVSADVPFEMPDCPDPSDSASPGPDVGNPEARAAAQRGLNYLAAEAVAWQKRSNCYGCHVQAVTVEAFSIGAHHQYAVDGDAFDAVIDGMLDKRGGAHKKGGFGHFKKDIARTAKVLGAAAFARYDQWVDTRVSGELVAEAELLRAMQRDDGSLDVEWGPRPVVVGPVQFAAQAIVTFEQAYDRTADDVWLAAVQRSEEYLQRVVAEWGPADEPYLQEISYAIIGLLAAGVQVTEDTMQSLEARLLARQQDDGSWSYGEGEKRASEAFATGQTLYVLRLMGMTDADDAIARGTAWLIARQRDDGAWSDHGFDKAEAMWAVLGLVSIDVLTVDVDGVRGGMHVSGVVPVDANARDNRGGGVRTVEVRVDDVLEYAECGAVLSYQWDTSALANGKHIVDVVATNAAGEESRRRFEVYAGSIYLTQIGTAFDAGSTIVSLRNVAPSSMGNEVSVSIYSTIDSAGAPTPHALLRTLRQRGSQGAMQFRWDGTDDAGGVAPSAAYVARVTIADDAGEVLQTEDVVFFHDTVTAENESYGQIQGQLRLAEPMGGDGATADNASEPAPEPAANTVVELWDETNGTVVQSTTSTASGNYRFKNVKPGKKYRVRVNKRGYHQQEGDVSVSKGVDNPYMDMDLVAQ